MRPRTSKKRNKEIANAYERLYGKAQEVEQAQERPSLEKRKVALRKVPIRKVATCLPEWKEQLLLVTWMSKKDILYCASANGGSRDAREGANLKRSGVQAGWPDIFIPIQTKTHGGMFIELKRKDGGRVSDMQKYWIEKLNKQGYHAIVCKGADEAMKEINGYIGLGETERYVAR